MLLIFMGKLKPFGGSFGCDSNLSNISDHKSRPTVAPTGPSVRGMTAFFKSSKQF